MPLQSEPRLVSVAALWTTLGHPSPHRPWSLARRFREAAREGFDGIAGSLTPAHRRLADACGMEHRIGLLISRESDDFRRILDAQKEGGAHLVNVQLGAHDTPPSVAVRQWIELERLAEKLGLEVSLETHRGTCTETPEKTLEIAARYAELTRGRLLRLTCDFSHHAVVKHLAPDEYAPRLLAPAELIAHARLCHLRPFNGHHVQVPVLGAGGRLTPEAKTYLDFVETFFRVWKETPAEGPRLLYACPEIGPLRSGYSLSGLPPAWPCAVRLNREVTSLWKGTKRAPQAPDHFRLASRTAKDRLRASSTGTSTP